MSVEVDIWTLLLSLGIFQGFFISPLLLKGNNYRGKWLGFLVLIIVAMMLNYLLINIRFYRIWPHFIDITTPLLFLIGPFYYFYIKSLLTLDSKLRFSDLKHFLLFLGFCILHMEFFFMPTDQKIQILDATIVEGYTHEATPAFVLPIVIHVVQTSFYLHLANTFLKKVDQSSNALNQQLKMWLKRFTIGFAGYWIIAFSWLIYLAVGNGFFYQVDYVFILSIGLLVHLLGYTVIYHNKEFSQYLLALVNNKYVKSSLSVEQSKGILNKIIKVIEEDKIYLDPNLKIADLARRLSLSSNIISQVINQETNKNFYEFINEYRIYEAMRRLSDPKYGHIKIISIALDSGFSNKNTFNRLFKKHTGLTPSQFIRNQ